MSDRKYFCFCADNCRFETMTKEQILAAIAQAAAGGLVFDVDAAFITKVKEGNAGGSVTFWRGTQAQYNAIAEKDPACMYIITDSTEKQDMLNAIEAAKEAAEKASAEAAVGVKICKLWENANYDADFPAQEINVGSWTGYDMVEIMYNFSATTAYSMSQRAAVAFGTSSIYLNGATGTSNRNASRKVDIARDGKITFAAATYNDSTNNSYLIPVAIYGIKGVSSVVNSDGPDSGIW